MCVIFKYQLLTELIKWILKCMTKTKYITQEKINKHIYNKK